MTDLAKALALDFAILLSAGAIFGFFSIFAFHANFSLTGCSLGLALASLLWAWVCWRSEEPTLRTFVTLLLHSTILFLLFLGISLLRFMIAAVAAWNIVAFITTAVVFMYLRSVAIRRNEKPLGKP